MNAKRPTSNGAFTVLEMLATLMLASTVLLMASKLANPLSRATRSEIDRQNEVLRQNSFERRLRDDVADAKSLNVDSKTRLNIVTDANEKIVWRIEEGEVIRDAGVDPQRWEKALMSNATFRSLGAAAVELRGLSRTGEMKTFTSPTLQLSGWADR